MNVGSKVSFKYKYLVDVVVAIKGLVDVLPSESIMIAFAKVALTIIISAGLKILAVSAMQAMSLRLGISQFLIHRSPFFYCPIALKTLSLAALAASIFSAVIPSLSKVDPVLIV